VQVALFDSGGRGVGTLRGKKLSSGHVADRDNGGKRTRSILKGKRDLGPRDLGPVEKSAELVGEGNEQEDDA